MAALSLYFQQEYTPTQCKGGKAPMEEQLVDDTKGSPTKGRYSKVKSRHEKRRSFFTIKKSRCGLFTSMISKKNLLKERVGTGEDY
jgi:hypothetical protein